MAALQGRHALVTGGGRGIGRAIAAALTGAGATVTVVGRSEAALQEAVAAGDAAGYVRRRRHRRAARSATSIERAAAARGPIDILVANAGGAESAPFAKTDAGAVPPACSSSTSWAWCMPRQAVLGRHGRARLRPHRRDRLDRRAEGLRLRVGLLRGEARRGRPGALARARDREDRRHRQCGLSRLHRHRHGARQRRRGSSRRPAARRPRPLAAILKDNPLGRLDQAARRSPPPCFICARRMRPR